MLNADEEDTCNDGFNATVTDWVGKVFCGCMELDGNGIGFITAAIKTEICHKFSNLWINNEDWG